MGEVELGGEEGHLVLIMMKSDKFIIIVIYCIRYNCEVFVTGEGGRMRPSRLQCITLPWDKRLADNTNTNTNTNTG